MNDISIFVWNLVLSFLDLFFAIVLMAYYDSNYNKFYERVKQYISIFVFIWILFAVTINRSLLYTSYIFHGISEENCSGWKIINFLFSWIPFVGTIIVFLWAFCYFVDLFSYNAYCHDEEKVFCSIKTIKLITTFSSIEYDDDNFYYQSKNGEKILLCFSPIVYIVLCFYAHSSDKKLNKIVQREENRNKEQKLYKALISDLEKIKRENEKEANKCFEEASENFQKLSKNMK